MEVMNQGKAIDLDHIKGLPYSTWSCLSPDTVQSYLSEVGFAPYEGKLTEIIQGGRDYLVLRSTHTGHNSAVIFKSINPGTQDLRLELRLLQESLIFER